MNKLLSLVCSLVLCLGLLACSGVSSAALEDGTYRITADTDSSMFRIESCTLVVEDGAMTAQASLPGQGFSRLYFGSPDEAATAPADEIYEYYVNDEGKYTFDIPVTAFDEEVEVAAYGHRRDMWYPHTIVFHVPTDGPLAQDDAGSASLEGSVSTLEAGEYHVGVTLDGGTGRASVQSPATVTVADGKMTLTIVWSSPNYDQMVVDGVQYLPVNESGNSTFEIPITSIDDDLAIQAETTAMSEPHMIDYTLHFDAESLAR